MNTVTSPSDNPLPGQKLDDRVGKAIAGFAVASAGNAVFHTFNWEGYKFPSQFQFPNQLGIQVQNGGIKQDISTSGSSNPGKSGFDLSKLSSFQLFDKNNNRPEPLPKPDQGKIPPVTNKPPEAGSNTIQPGFSIPVNFPKLPIGNSLNNQAQPTLPGNTSNNQISPNTGQTLPTTGVNNGDQPIQQQPSPVDGNTDNNQISPNPGQPLPNNGNQGGGGGEEEIRPVTLPEGPTENTGIPVVSEILIKPPEGGANNPVDEITPEVNPVPVNPDDLPIVIGAGTGAAVAAGVGKGVDAGIAAIIGAENEEDNSDINDNNGLVSEPSPQSSISENEAEKNPGHSISPSVVENSVNEITETVHLDDLPIVIGSGTGAAVAAGAGKGAESGIAAIIGGENNEDNDNNNEPTLSISPTPLTEGNINDNPVNETTHPDEENHVDIDDIPIAIGAGIGAAVAAGAGKGAESGIAAIIGIENDDDNDDNNELTLNISPTPITEDTDVKDK